MLDRTSIHGGNINETTFESIVVFLTHEIINEKCIFPKKTVFIEDTLTRFGNKTHLNQEQFKDLFNALNLGENETADEPGHGHDEGDHHSHKRRRRSINQEAHKNDVNMVRFLG